MSLKDKLVKEVGIERATEIMSEMGKEMRSKVKKPYQFTPEAAKKAAEKRWKQTKA